MLGILAIIAFLAGTAAFMAGWTTKAKWGKNAVIGGGVVQGLSFVIGFLSFLFGAG